MTICGYRLTGQYEAIAWADSGIYRDGAPAGDACKMMSNPLATLISFGSGGLPELRDANRMLHECNDLEEALLRIPAGLRRGRQEEVANRSMRSALAASRFAIVGMNHKLDRVQGYVLRPDDNFSPVPARAFCSPHIDGAAMSIANEQDAVRVARAQFNYVRREIPTAAGGSLTLARFSGEQIKVWSLPDFANADGQFDRATRMRTLRRLSRGGEQ